ncbi:MAG: glycosyltransferase [Candidatus Uhrbacteria bacterium]|nr:glycosyltransferase [Candidatus Uhrbacteria bacterium]
MGIPSQKTLILAIKYALVGASSTIIDVGVLALLVEYGHLHLLVAAVISFCVAVGNGFFWNKRWTFQNTSAHLTRQYIKFFLTSLVGLGLNLLLLSFLVYFFHLWYVIAKMVTTVAVFFWNFTANKFWTFRSYVIARPPIDEKSSCDISVLIPAYNEEHDIKNGIEDVMRFLRPRFETWEIICIDDGSTDATAKIIQALSRDDSRIRLIIHVKNEGKGASVRDGVRAAHGALILFMDADGSTPISQFDVLAPFFSQGADIVIGSRYLKESSIIRKQPWYRIALGRIGNLFIQALLLDAIKDTQCGFKAFTFPSAKALFKKSTVNRWGFDMEILALAQHMGYTIKEVPVQWHDSETRTSRFRPIKDAHRTFRELLRIKWNLIAGAYTLTKEKK